jgi:ABC-type Mn2+/Zn2+ transport system permease subunit
MQALTLWVTVIGIVLVVAYLVAPGSQAPDVLKGFGEASATSIRALGGGVSFR